MSPAGRPEIGHPINIRLEDELLAAVDELAEALGQSRAATIRALIRDSLTRWWPEVQDESNGEMLGQRSRRQPHDRAALARQVMRFGVRSLPHTEQHRCLCQDCGFQYVGKHPEQWANIHEVIHPGHATRLTT